MHADYFRVFWNRDYDVFNDHAPPHFHAKYGEFEALIRIDPLGIIQGRLPPRA